MPDNTNTPGEQQNVTEVHHHNGGGGGNTWLILLVVVIVVLLAIFVFRGTTNAPEDNNVIPENIDVNIYRNSPGGK